MDKHFVHSNIVPGLGPFAHKADSLWAFAHVIKGTPLVRCWHHVLFFGAWSASVCAISKHAYDLSVNPALLTSLGVVLGFVISYRTVSSFERYNEGRRLWSQVTLCTRNLARTVWFHVPEVLDGQPEKYIADETRSRVLIEKVTVINLLLAFAISVKHYLRGETGIHYEDLYPLVKFLPHYQFPTGLPLVPEAHGQDDETLHERRPQASEGDVSSTEIGSSPDLHDIEEQHELLKPPRNEAQGPTRLAPSRQVPKWGVYDLFPLSLFVAHLVRKGADIKGKKAARARMMLRDQNSWQNIPLEISLYLSSYISHLQSRKALETPTAIYLLNNLNLLVDSLTGLERILTTPIPFSYSTHLYTVTSLYCLLLPFQLWSTLEWVTIPGTVIVAYIFFGFLVNGDEIEGPFGYDRNDLNMDHFVHNIIEKELRALIARPPPDIASWAFAPENDTVVGVLAVQGTAVDAPETWVLRGPEALQAALCA